MEYSFTIPNPSFIGNVPVKKGDVISWGGSDNEGKSSVTYAFYINDKTRVENKGDMLHKYLTRTRNRADAEKLLNKK